MEMDDTLLVLQCAGEGGESGEGGGESGAGEGAQSGSEGGEGEEQEGSEQEGEAAKKGEQGSESGEGQEGKEGEQGETRQEAAPERPEPATKAELGELKALLSEISERVGKSGNGQAPTDVLAGLSEDQKAQLQELAPVIDKLNAPRDAVTAQLFEEVLEQRFLRDHPKAAKHAKEIKELRRQAVKANGGRYIPTYEETYERYMGQSLLKGGQDAVVHAAREQGRKEALKPRATERPRGVGKPPAKKFEELSIEEMERRLANQQL